MIGQCISNRFNKKKSMLSYQNDHAIHRKKKRNTVYIL